MPDVSKRDRNHENDCFILIACDGIWDVVTSAEANQYIREVKEERTTETPRQALLEGMFDDFIAEDVDDQNSV